jgi:hypothetical protein
LWARLKRRPAAFLFILSFKKDNVFVFVFVFVLAFLCPKEKRIGFSFAKTKPIQQTLNFSKYPPFSERNTASLFFTESPSHFCQFCMLQKTSLFSLLLDKNDTI